MDVGIASVLLAPAPKMCLMIWDHLTLSIKRADRNRARKFCVSLKLLSLVERVGQSLIVHPPKMEINIMLIREFFRGKECISVEKAQALEILALTFFFF
jgi:hypothetical protein